MVGKNNSASAIVKAAIHVCLLFACGTAHSKVFSNSFLQINVPNHWKCALKGAEWECKDSHPIRGKESAIILSAKIAAPEDHLNSYKRYLGQSITPSGPTGKPSKVLGIAQIELNGHPWIDGYHFGSEIPTWYTRYLATVSNNLAILVSFSNHMGKNEYYKKLFSQMAGSLKIKMSPQLSQQVQAKKPPRPAPVVPAPIPKTIYEEPLEDDSVSGFQLPKNFHILLGAALLILVGIVYFLKK